MIASKVVGVLDKNSEADYSAVKAMVGSETVERMFAKAEKIIDQTFSIEISKLDLKPGNILVCTLGLDLEDGPWIPSLQEVEAMRDDMVGLLKDLGHENVGVFVYHHGLKLQIIDVKDEQIKE